MSTRPDGQYANDETDVSSVFIPNLVNIDQVKYSIVIIVQQENFVTSIKN